MEINVDKRERSSNFTFEETDILVGLIEERRAIIECKKTDTVTNKTKEKEWENLTNLYNSKCLQFRTAKMLRSKWESLKKIARKELAIAQKEPLKTESGTEERVRRNPWIDRVISITGEDVNGLVTSENNRNYEGTTIYEENIIASTSTQYMSQSFPIVLEGTSTDGSTIQLKTENNVQWDTWSPTMLKQPTETDLQINIQESLVNNIPDHIPDSSSRQRFIRKKKRRSVSPTTETNKKFSDLVDKKLQLIQIQIDLLQKESEARMDMERERHNMQMKILEAELKLKEKMLSTNHI